MHLDQFQHWLVALYFAIYLWGAMMLGLQRRWGWFILCLIGSIEFSILTLYF